MNEDLECLSEWLEGNKSKLNLMKIKYTKLESNENISVLIDGKVDETNMYLGSITDKDLKFKENPNKSKEYRREK